MVVGFVVLAPAGRQAACGGRRRAGVRAAAGPALPTGLTVSRTASYEPSSGQARLSVAYAAQKAPLSGDFLEVIPGLARGRVPGGHVGRRVGEPEPGLDHRP